ncbi:MAG: aminoacyl-tRNA hydrolase [Pirellulaceae bacterium]
MKAIVGLGNPGKKYEGTRHNIGFECIRRLADRWGVSRFQSKFNAEFADANVNGQRVLLVFPLTYMNLSGDAVKPLMDFFRLPLSELLVICDDLALPPGKIRLRAKGSSGGQKGLKNICERLKSEEISRLRIGIGETPENWQTPDYVLSKFSPIERETIDNALDRSVQAVESWMTTGIVATMNRFNSEPTQKNESEKKKNNRRNPSDGSQQ